MKFFSMYQHTAKVVHEQVAKRIANAARIGRGDKSLLVGASFLRVDYSAKAGQPTNAKHLAVEPGLISGGIQWYVIYPKVMQCFSDVLVMFRNVCYLYNKRILEVLE